MLASVRAQRLVCFFKADSCPTPCCFSKLTPTSRRNGFLAGGGGKRKPMGGRAQSRRRPRTSSSRRRVSCSPRRRTRKKTQKKTKRSCGTDWVGLQGLPFCKELGVGYFLMIYVFSGGGGELFPFFCFFGKGGGWGTWRKSGMLHPVFAWLGLPVVLREPTTGKWEHGFGMLYSVSPSGIPGSDIALS